MMLHRQEATIDPFHLADVQDVASSSVLRTGVQTLAALGGGDLVLFQAPSGAREKKKCE